MWGGLIISVAVALWAIIFSLNQGVMTRFQTSRSELLASKLMAEHDCGMNNGVCKGGYIRDPSFARNSSGTSYTWTYTLSTYQKGDAYLPIVVEKARNTSVCVATVGASQLMNDPGVSSFCPSLPPAEINPSPLPQGGLVLYQRRR